MLIHIGGPKLCVMAICYTHGLPNWCFVFKIMVGHPLHTHDIVELIKRFKAYYFSSIMLQESSMASLHLIFSWKMHMSLWMESIGYGTNNTGVLSTSLQVPRVEHLKKLYPIYYKNMNSKDVSCAIVHPLQTTNVLWRHFLNKILNYIFKMFNQYHAQTNLS